MKQAAVILTLVLFCLMLPALVMAKKPGSGVPSDSLRLRFIEPLEQKIQINCIGFDGRIYFIDDFIISKQDILAKKTCFILNKDFVYTELKANSREFPLLEYANVNGSNFDPVMDQASFETIKQKCNIYELGFTNIASLPDTIRISFKYHLRALGQQRTFKVVNNLLQMSGKYFWYARNPNLENPITLLVKTSDTMAFSLDGKGMNYDMKHAYTKEYLTELIDSKSSPAIIIFQRKS